MFDRLESSRGGMETSFCLPLFLTGENGLYIERGAVVSTTRGLESNNDRRVLRFCGVDGGSFSLGCVCAAAVALESFL